MSPSDTATMAAIAVRYFDGRSARRHAATLDVAAGQWVVAGDFGRRSGAVDALQVSEPMGGAPRVLTWPDGAFCEIADTEGLARLLALAGHRPSPVIRLQARWAWALAALAGVAGVLVLAYVSVLPWLAAQLAPAIPERVTTAISRQVLELLDEHVLTPSKLPPVRQQAITQRLAEVSARVPGLPAHRLHFRGGERVGPNAFALPSGDIVVLDPLVALAAGDDEVVGVIAHELGHVAHHHGLRQMIQSTVVSFVVGLWFGDVSNIAASLGTLLLESRYSREFEFEADRFGARVMQSAGMSPALLAAMLEKLEIAHAARPGGKPGVPATEPAGQGQNPAPGAGESGGTLLSSHPQTAERIAVLRGLAGGR